MRVLFATWGWRSHLFPLIPLAWAFRAAGHHVHVASQPALMEPVSACGLTGVRTGRDIGDDILVRHENPEITLLDPRTSHPGYVWDETEIFRWQIMKAIFSMIAERMVDDLVSYTDDWRPHLIVSDQTTFAASVAALATGTPHVRFLYGPDVTGPRGRDLEPRLRPAEFLRLFDRFGLPAPYDLAPWTLDPCPPGMRVPTDVERLAIRHVPFNGGAQAPAWLRTPPSRPRICVSWGTTQLAIADESTVAVPRILRALAGMDVEVLVVGADSYRHLLTDVPGNTTVHGWLPLDEVIPTCSAVIHQGGSGTALTAAGAGVPQLMFPQVADQGIHAERLANTGAGHVAAPGDDIGAVVGELLGASAYRDAAGTLAKEIRSLPAPAEAVRALESRL